MRVFISGPITKGDRANKAKIEAARLTFNSAEKVLISRGHTPVNPFKLIPDATEMTWEECMRINLKAMLDCDAIYQLIGWHSSPGALLENQVASKLNFVFLK